MKHLSSMIESFAYKYGKDKKQVLNDLLTYIIGYMNPDRQPDPFWKYSKEQNEEFHAMFTEYLRVMDEQLKSKEWYDAWGDLFMELTPKGGARGQFFTPVDMCDLMAQAVVDTKAERKGDTRFGKRVVIGDPAAGSSRNLLASHARFVHDKQPIPYLVAEDVDLMCCKMSAVNLMAHGCIGEVICHNTLTDPKGLLVGYIINEGLYPLQPGLPTIRVKKEPEWFYSLH